MRDRPGKIRLSAVIAVVAAVLSGVALFWTAQRVQTSESRLRELQDAAASEKQAMHVLHAEWDYLNRPDRLEALARDQLHMSPPQPGEVVRSAAALTDPPPAPLQKKGKAQRAVMLSPAAAPQPAPPPVAQPAPPQPPAAAGNRSFQDLLKDIDKGGAP